MGFECFAERREHREGGKNSSELCVGGLRKWNGWIWVVEYLKMWWVGSGVRGSHNL
jgi:hypothetical protein